MKTLICLILSSLILSSCTTLKKCQQKFPQVASRDSIYIEKLDTVKIVLPGDTVKIEVPINCPDQDILVMENGKLLQSLKIVNGLLKQKLIIKGDTVTKFVTNTVTKIVEVKKPVEVKYVPKFTLFMSRLGILLSILIVAYLAFKIRSKMI